MRTREQIITSMCHTWRHDYGLDKDTESGLSSGMTISERHALWNQMAQIFDNDIAPHMKIVKPRLSAEERIQRREGRRELKQSLDYSRIGADAFKRGL